MEDAPSEIGGLADLAEALLSLVSGVVAGDFLVEGPFRAECVGLARKVSLLVHLLEEIRDFAGKGDSGGDASATTSAAAEADPSSFLTDLMVALEAAKRFLLFARDANSDLVSKDLAIQFQYVTWQLEKALGNLPFEYLEISDEVQEEVELVRAQLRRSTEKHGASNLTIFQEIHHVLPRAKGKAVKRQLSRSSRLKTSKTCDADLDVQGMVELAAEVNGICKSESENIISSLIEKLDATDSTKVTKPSKVAALDSKSSMPEQKTSEETKKPDVLVIPEDFRCPISLELMRDPVIVSTGQTYERSFIQRWIDCGNETCPKTQQKLQNLTLTPNYVLRSLIMQWCETHRIEQPLRSTSGRLRKGDGSFHEANDDIAAIGALIHNLSIGTSEERRSAAAEIRSLAKSCTENRILIAEAGAIPVLVNLLSADDLKTQEHAVTSLLNLSIYDNNKDTIILAGAISPIIRVLRRGSMEARENAAAAIFSLSLNDENKITIGGTPGAMESLVGLLRSGSPRGKKDAATALFNLCIYQGNKTRAVRAGILTPLVQMLEDPSSGGMVDEALTILSVLVSHNEGKAAISRVNTIPLLIDLLRAGQPRNKENATAILLALCKKDAENLACIGRLGAQIPLAELAKSGTDRAKRKANTLLDQLHKMQVM